MTVRRYISIDHYQAPFRGAVLQGLGASRTYYETSQFRSPYRHGYFQDNTLMGLGAPGDVGAVNDPAIATLQQKLGVRTTGMLDGPTQAAIQSAQAKNKLPVTGVPDAALLAALGLIDPNAIPPSAAPWRRDLNTALSQVPPLGYGALAVAFFAIAYYGYSRWKKERPAQSEAA